MARTAEGTKHPALLAKRRQALINGVEAAPEWSMLGYDQQQFISRYMVVGDAYEAGEQCGRSLEWVNQQMANDAFITVIEQVRQLPNEYVRDVARQRMPAVLERLWAIIEGPNDNTARAAIKDWTVLAGLVKTDAPPGSTFNYNNLNNIKMFGNQGSIPPSNLQELQDMVEVEVDA